MAQDPLNLLVVEPHFPGRLGAVADWLVRRRGYHAWFFCRTADPQEHWPEATGHGLEVVSFNVGGVARETSVAWTRQLERGLCYAYGGWEVIDARKPRPIDVALGRSAGLGSTLFLPVTYPRVPIVNQHNYYYHARANDLADDAAPEMPPEFFHWRRAGNAMDLLELESGATPWVATAWQRDLFPPEYRDDFLVLFDGVDCRRFRRPKDDGPRRRMVAGRAIPADTRVVSFVARGPDWVRGYDRFVRLANRMLRERSDVLCIVAGSGPVMRMLDIRHYGRDFASAVHAEQPIADPSRFWPLGTVSNRVVAELLNATDLHVDGSRRYIASRTLAEAMASGTVILAWDSPPAREFLDPGRTGLLAPDDESAADLALSALSDPASHRPLGLSAAAEARERLDQDVTLPGLATLLNGLAGLG